MTHHELGTQACPSEEDLAAYLGGIASVDRQNRIDQHLQHCDACLEAVIAASRRWWRDPMTEEAVPESVRMRTARSHESHTATAASEETPSAKRGQHSRFLLARQWWIVSVLAASIVLVTVPVWRQALRPELGERATRSVETSRLVRIGASRVQVLAAPHPRAPVVETLLRGDVVRLGVQERDWYRVELADGRQGWIPTEAVH